MFPQVFPRKNEGKRRAERHFFDCCKTQLDDSWVVIYSQDWLGKRINGANERGEADFVLLNSQFGIFVVEVKGGQQIFRRENTWYTIPHHSNTPEKIKNPFTQAGESKSVLWEFISKQLPQIKLKDVFKHSVVFPGHIQVGDMGSEAPRQIICDVNDLKVLPQTLLRVFKYFGARGSLGEEEVEKIVKLLVPTDILRGEQHLDYLSTVDKIKDFAKIEATTFKILPSQKSLVILGGVGAALNELAFGEAEKFATSGIKTLFVCGLMDTTSKIFRERRDALGINTNFLEIYGVYQLWTEVIGGLRAIFKGGDLQSLWVEADKSKYLCDVLVVCQAEEIPAYRFAQLRSLLRDNGRLLIFGDRNLEPLSGSAISSIPGIEIVNLNIESTTTTQIAQFANDVVSTSNDLIGADGMKPKFVSARVSLIMQVVKSELTNYSHSFNIKEANIALVALSANTNEILEYEDFGLTEQVWSLSRISGQKFDIVIAIITPDMLGGAFNYWHKHRDLVLNALQTLKERDLDAEREFLIFEDRIASARDALDADPRRVEQRRRWFEERDKRPTDSEVEMKLEKLREGLGIFHKRGMRTAKFRESDETFPNVWSFDVEFKNVNLARIYREVKWETARKDIYKMLKVAKVAVTFVTTPELLSEMREVFKVDNL